MTAANRPRLLDLFCGAGGAAAGYVRAGFDVTGVDHKPQKNYLKSGASAFVQADALEYCREHGHEYDAIHASPPCQAHTSLRSMWNSREHPELAGCWRCRPTTSAACATATTCPRDVVESVDDVIRDMRAVVNAAREQFDVYVGRSLPYAGDGRMRHGGPCVSSRGGVDVAQRVEALWRGRLAGKRRQKWLKLLSGLAGKRLGVVNELDEIHARVVARLIGERRTAMTLAEASRIVGVMTTIHMKGMGVPVESDDTWDHSWTLAQLLEANALVDAENDRRAKEPGPTTIQVVCADRLIAALYVLHKYPPANESVVNVGRKCVAVVEEPSYEEVA